MTIFVTFYLSVIFFLSGLAIRYGDRISFYMMLIFPFFLYLHSFLKKEKVFFPKKLTLVWFGFSFFDLLSTIFSLNHQVSIERFILYQSAYLIGIYFYNHQEKYRSVIEKIIIFFGIIYTFAYIFKDSLLSLIRVINVNQAYNLFFPIFENRNSHLGVWLGLVILIFIIKKKLTPLIFFLPFFLISYSRTAYISLFISYLFLTFLNNNFFKSKKILFWSTLILLLMVFIFTVYLFVPRGSFLSNHHFYILEALLGFKDRPFFGYGPGNFVSISRIYAVQFSRTFGETSHNLFTDVLSESGLLSFLAFSMFFYSIFKNRSRNSEYYYLLIYFLAVFIFSYIHSMKMVFLLFMIIVSLAYKEREALKLKRTVIIFCFTIFVFSAYLAYSEALYFKESYVNSLKLYPYRQEAFIELITTTSLFSKDKIYFYLDLYKKYFPFSSERIRFSADIYNKIGDYRKSLNSYLEIFNNGSGFEPATAREIYFLYIKLGDRKGAREFVESFARRVISDPIKYGHITRGTVMLCANIYKYTGEKYECF